MKTVLRFVDKLSTWTGVLSSYLILPVTAVVCYEVIARYVFHKPTLWVTESMIIGCAFIYVLGAGWTMLEGRHVKIDLLWVRLSKRNQKLLDIISSLFFFLYICFLLWFVSIYAFESVKLLEKAGSPWDPPLYPLKLAFAFGVVLLLLQGIAKLIRDLMFILTGEE